jgi:hypothetical protein
MSPPWRGYLVPAIPACSLATTRDCWSRSSLRRRSRPLRRLPAHSQRPRRRSPRRPHRCPWPSRRPRAHQCPGRFRCNPVPAPSLRPLPGRSRPSPRRCRAKFGRPSRCNHSPRRQSRRRNPAHCRRPRPCAPRRRAARRLRPRCVSRCRRLARPLRKDRDNRSAVCRAEPSVADEIGPGRVIPGRFQKNVGAAAGAMSSRREAAGLYRSSRAKRLDVSQRPPPIVWTSE